MCSIYFWIFSLCLVMEKNSITLFRSILHILRTHHCPSHFVEWTLYSQALIIATQLLFGTLLVTTLGRFWRWHRQCKRTNKSGRTHGLHHFFPPSPFVTFVVLSHLRCAISGSSMVEIAAQCSKEAAEKLQKNADGSGSLPGKPHPDIARLPNFHHTDISATESGERL